ncbi:helix-turn-helix transcriptional regulator [Pseudomonas sp. CNPSo 3701]|uniref:helix-turn-helix transcriptional regulator n=1 Tax=Pseudomonas sp. CNPSo 3701 TaxID=3027943 RepID=UPI00236398D4|nr:helix-turn-helix transcriptional regulator [Pseudomonas sp. CNPSo 3701]MDD1507082.1 helix-turn-helix transcriptional regulator [Pseudomonas sp. CNPSo 3701]
MSTKQRFLCADRFAAFNTLTLELLRLAQNTPLTLFRQQALTQLQGVIGFDKAWWGRSALVDGLPEEHNSAVFMLPADYVEDWRSIREHDITVPLAQMSPGRSVIIDSQHEQTPDGLRWLGRKHGFGELLCVIHVDPPTQLVVHLTLYRRMDAPRFEADDQLLLDHLMPHLVAAEGANHIRALVALRETLNGPGTLALAVCDQQGVLHYAEHGFVDQLLVEWPNWQGSCLPPELTLDGYQGQRLTMQSTLVGDFHVLIVRPCSALNVLSARETDVAERFGGGRTYKEIARELGLAPNTVRHHIRSIYEKLGVSGKAGIAQLLNQPPN